MKTAFVLMFAASSLCLFGCGEEKKVTAEPTRAATSAAPSAAPQASASAKAAEAGGGW